MPNIDKYQEFLNYLNTIGSETTTEEELEALYDQNITITFNNHELQIPFDAISFNALHDLITELIKEY